MKYLWVILIFIIAGCAPRTQYIIERNGEAIDCTTAPTVWWGEAGDDPSENDLWKCFDWQLEVR